MYVRNGILYDNNYDACTVGNRVRVILDDNSVVEDVITWIEEEQDKGFEDNNIYFKNYGIVSIYNMKAVYKIFKDKETDKMETFIITASAEDETECEIELDENQLSTIISLFKMLDANRNTDDCPWYRIKDEKSNIIYETEPI